MIATVHGLAAALQTLLTEQADEAARESGFLVRRRKITGAGFVRALVLTWMADPDATLDDLAAPLGIAPQSLHQRLDSKAADCLRLVLRRAIGLLFGARPETIPLLRRFVAVAADDSTTVRLPAGLAGSYPGCGGPRPGVGEAGVKVLARLEVLTGEVRLVEPAPARASDRALRGSLPPLPPGSLRLADLGFFDLGRMARDTARRVSWISRVPARLSVSCDGEPPRAVAAWLGRRRCDRVDALVTLGAKGHRLACRLVAVRTPPRVAEARLARLERAMRKKGRAVSEAQRMLCRWTVMITNLVDAGRYSAEQLWALYRVRWQIELLFKRWKSGGGLDRSRGRNPGRVLCEFLAKLLAVLVKGWATLLRGGPLCVASAVRAGSRVRWWAGRLAEALGSGERERVEDVLGRLQADLRRLPRRPRRARPTTRQLLFAPKFAA